MSNPLRHPAPIRGKRRTNAVYLNVPKGRRVRAPARGRVVERHDGVAVIGPKGGVHQLDGVKPRAKLIGHYVQDQRWIGTTRARTITYRKRNASGRLTSVWPILRRPKQPKLRPYTKPWRGNYRLVTNKRYSSGAWHGAWDIGCWLGTPVFAPTSAYVREAHDGVPNNRPGYNPGTGAPSNYVYLWFVDPHGRRVSLLLQHLSPGVKVKTGDRVRAGQLLGYSGNTGNSTGPHLHVGAMHGYQTNRYQDYRDHGLCIYPPSSVWTR